MLYVFLSVFPFSEKSLEFQYGNKLFLKIFRPPLTSFSIWSLITIAPAKSAIPITKISKPYKTRDTSASMV